MEKLSRSFYARPTLEVARDLLGKCLIRRLPSGLLVGEITEVEAYIGEDDPACHAAHGRTSRTEVMYGEAGHAYVYFVYGMYHCLNIVTERAGFPAAVLIRAVALDLKTNIKSDGPGKLCQAFSITKQLNGVDLTTSNELWLEDRGRVPVAVHVTPRMGIKVGTDKLWRFVTSLVPTCSRSGPGTGSTRR